ncbi:transposase [Ornithinimicrobium cerasi]|uniref:Transposase IS116/IS110/IS902 family protein n=1 Tax=Ornithinimicrobium cerasi TaxID=2248773 RepID=A0A285VU73_9MICO|nr:transposase [Ornithinimicrobium cerasi]SOC57148.1 Transposase IS116/IS110/IS902 family protein [Ornithinimicrobium cerasi]
MLTGQVRDVDTRIAGLYAALDPAQIARTAPGAGPVLGAAITARLGDPHRFASLAAIRSYSGLVPKVSQSGQAEHHGGITKAGDPLLRQSLRMAADMARRADPQLASTYVRLMNAGRHHDTAICHVAHRRHPDHPQPPRCVPAHQQPGPPTLTLTRDGTAGLNL